MLPLPHAGEGRGEGGRNHEVKRLA
ncbi:protein of unknown function (plasmid) [Cupriavidus taiwanensis]|uniref:Uncharacterized protein n=1 Tax=Cupriavidus taiwanensis TaxID=164546 RepID=A0A9Q7XS75_9BURK|nr:protein of unknown function [Cupriavidus taiwanensis]